MGKAPAVSEIWRSGTPDIFSPHHASLNCLCYAVIWQNEDWPCPLKHWWWFSMVKAMVKEHWYPWSILWHCYNIKLEPGHHFCLHYPSEARQGFLFHWLVTQGLSVASDGYIGANCLDFTCISAEKAALWNAVQLHFDSKGACNSWPGGNIFTARSLKPRLNAASKHPFVLIEFCSLVMMRYCGFWKGLGTSNTPWVKQWEEVASVVVAREIEHLRGDPGTTIPL